MYKFNKEKDYLKNKLNKLDLYTSKQEKLALIKKEDISIFEILKIISPDSNPTNELEALIFIIKLSEISVSDIIEKIFECSNCSNVNEISIELQDLINLDIECEISNFPIGIFETPDDIFDNPDNLPLKDYNKISDIIEENNLKIFNVHLNPKCRTCKTENNIVINPIDLISRTTIAGIYDEYFNISFYSHNTIRDIDSMFPFERELYLSLLKKQIEKNPLTGLQG